MSPATATDRGFMRALTIRPRVAMSARLDRVPIPEPGSNKLLVRALAVGICGTDRELIDGRYGFALSGSERMTIGHESLGVVASAPEGCGFAAGDHLAGIVRRPDPVPCAACAVDEWDMCCNGEYTERGIKQRDGYCSEWFVVDPAFAVKVKSELGLPGVLTEPASVVAKAWDQIEYIGRRSRAWHPARALITGAGPVGLLAMLLARQRGLETHVYDQEKTGPKPQLVHDAGAHYYAGDIGGIAHINADVVIECTGAPAVVHAVMSHNARNSVVCLAGLSPSGRDLPFDLAALNQSMVLQNDVVFGTVNANRRHYELASQALERADSAWLHRLISRRVSLDDWRSALQRQPDDIKTVIDFTLS